ncbi:MAG TPA: ABC transporter substrate-binding protein [Stellaceae bacterium]|nr:ABC transporter substrate-binding protein [Stellaceae bacterium]
MPNELGRKALVISVRHLLLGLCLIALCGVTTTEARAEDTVRIGLPTKTYWPTIVAETAVRQKLFDKEGIKAELTIYRSGGEAFEGLAAGAADMILDPPSLVATGITKGIKSKIVAGGALAYYGWHLMVPTGSKITDVAQLAGKKVGITAAGSGSDLLALWTMQDRKISFTRVPLGGGGLVPNLLSGNVDAIVLYSPLTFQELRAKEAVSLIDFGTAVPPHLNSGWIATDKLIREKPQLVQKTVNALYGALAYLRNNREPAIKLIAEIDEIKPEIAAAEYEGNIVKLSADGEIKLEWVTRSLELAALGGMTGLAPASETFVTSFKPVPTKP